MAIDPKGISDKKSNFITRSVQQANELLDTITTLEQMIEEANIQAFSTTIADVDFTGSNNHIDKAALVAFYVSLQAILTLLQATSNTHFKNLYNMKR